jgi:hypothetical protein
MFRHIILRLMFQNEFQQEFQERPHDAQVLKDYITTKVDFKPDQGWSKITEVYNAIKTDKSVLFVVIGEWASLVTRNDGCATEPQPINNNAIFLLRNQGVGSCRIEIIGEAGKALIKVPITENFSYHVDG